MPDSIKEWLEKSLLATAGFMGRNLELQEILFDIQSRIKSQIITFKHSVEKSDLLLGAYMPLVTNDETLAIGLFSDFAGCEYLTGLFLKSSIQEEKCVKGDVADAFKEMINIITGLLIRESNTQMRKFIRGMPVFVDGFMRLTSKDDSGCAVFKIADFNYYITIVKSNSDRKENLRQQMVFDDVQSIDQWFGETMTATFAFALESLGTEKYKVSRFNPDKLSNEIVGAYLPLVGAKDVVLIGLLVEKDKLVNLARLFLKVPDDCSVHEADAVDAVKEMLNVLSGMIKRQLFSKRGVFKRGLPVFVDGMIAVGENEEHMSVVINIKDIDAYLVIIKKSGHAG